MTVSTVARVLEKRRAWAVHFDGDAVVDFEEVRSKGDRKAVFNAVYKLRHLGPDLHSPHVKSLKGETDLFELRPKRGAVAVRPIFGRFGDRFLILAIARDKSHFDRAVENARSRLSRPS
jgi:hypothetical protein